MSDLQKMFIDWLTKRCSSLPGIASAAVGVREGLIYLRILAETPDYDDPNCLVPLHQFALKLNDELELAYPGWTAIIELVVPPKGLSAKEVLELPPDRIINLSITKKTSIN